MLTQPLIIQARYGWKPDVHGRALEPAGEQFRFLVRTITRREFRDWGLRYPDWMQPGNPDSYRFEDAIVQHCVLETPFAFHNDPWNWENVYAGLASQLSARILELSGLGSTLDPGIVARVESYLGSELARTDTLIVTAFDGMTVSQLFEMDPEEYQISLALAYAKLRALGMDPESILHPEQKRKGRAPLPGVPAPAPAGIQGFPAGGGRHQVVTQQVTEASGAWGSLAPEGTAGHFYRNPNA